MVFDISVQNFMREWFFSDDPNLFRIHVSHTDMDGYGCFVVSDYIDSVLNTNGTCRLVATSQLTASNPNMVSKELSKQFDKFITEFTEEERQRTRYLVLVTDLTPNPEVFRYLLSNYKMVGMDFCVIDHHQDLNDYESKITVDSILSRFGTYYINQQASATKLLTSFAIQCVTEMSSIDAHEMESLLTYTAAVSLYDTGNWGKWRCDKLEDVDPSVLEYLLFAVQRDKIRSNPAALEEYVKHRLDMLQRKVPIGSENSGCYEVIKSKFKEIELEWNRVLINLVDMSMPNTPVFMIPGLPDKMTHTVYVKGPRVRGLIVKPGDQDYSFFSLIARELLDDPDMEMDIMVIVNMRRKNVDLRSARNGGPDVSLIAKSNNGGGHVHAAGFPLKSIVEDI